LCHSLIQKLFTNYSAQQEDTNCLPPRWQQQATRGPTYSMARAIVATGWQRGFICQCHYLHWVTVELNCHMDPATSPGHIHKGYIKDGESATSV